MGCTYVKEFKFGGEVKAKTPPAVKVAVHKHENAMHPGKRITQLKTGGKVAAKPKCNGI